MISALSCRATSAMVSLEYEECWHKKSSSNQLRQKGFSLSRSVSFERSGTFSPFGWRMTVWRTPGGRQSYCIDICTQSAESMSTPSDNLTTNQGSNAKNIHVFNQCSCRQVNIFHMENICDGLFAYPVVYLLITV